MYDELVARLRNTAQLADKGLLIPPSICLEAADVIDELSVVVRVQRAALEKFPHWIPVTERLPDQGESVLVYRRGDNRVQPKMRIDVCPYLGDGIFCLLGVAYWMPLPEPPKED